MKVELEKAFPMPAAPEAAWALLQDIEAVAACMPGAKITQRIDDTHYKGTVTVQASVRRRSPFAATSKSGKSMPASRTLRLFGNGSDTTGSSAGSMDLTARIDAADGGLSALNGQSVVSLSGKAAAFGGRMVNSVADQILGAVRREFRRADPGARAAARATGRAGSRRVRGFVPCAGSAIAGGGARARGERNQRPRAAVGDLQGLAARTLRRQAGMMSSSQRMAEVVGLQQQLAGAGYIAERSLAAALLLMTDLGRPLLLEGDAGVGKTEVAKALARVRDTRLIRLQCYEGLDAHAAMYEWNYQRQLLAIKLLEQDERSVAAKEQDIFSERYLLKRPLLEAITCATPPVLLIDEVDRADEAFEAYLLELLSDFQMSIPELGTVKATSVPLVVVTSNGTRELSDALRRRCLYQYVDYPSFEKELAIIEAKLPQAGAALSRQLVAFVQAVRRLDLQKKPGIAETLDWAAALLRLGIASLDADGPERIVESLAALVKTRDDRAGFTREVVARIAAAC